MANRLGEDRVSKTAAGSATWRALGALEPDPRLRNPDFLARLFLPPVYALALRLPSLARLGNRLYGRLLPGGYQFEMARTRHMDSVLLRQLRKGVEQVVILGAGYDTRAHRFSPELGHCRVFEVDMPEIQRHKQKCLTSNEISTPSQLRYVSVGRDHKDLFCHLTSAGYQSSGNALFIWSGVTMYLQESSFHETLMGIRRHSMVGSTIVFDYFSPAVVSRSSDDYGGKQVARRVRKLGEPLSFGIDRAEVAECLAMCGFELVSNLGPTELERRYLRADGKSLGRSFGFASIADAQTGAQS